MLGTLLFARSSGAQGMCVFKEADRYRAASRLVRSLMLLVVEGYQSCAFILAIGAVGGVAFSVETLSRESQLHTLTIRGHLQ